MENERQRGNDIGATGLTVGANVARIRRARGQSLQGLADQMTAIGRKVSVSGLSKIENGTRKVDVDDLMALAVCLDTPPPSLLLPRGEPDAITQVTGVTASLALLWEWMTGAGVGISTDEERDFQARALPGWLTVDSEVQGPDGSEVILGVVRPDGWTERQVIRFGVPTVWNPDEH
ncbi:helix-turn-helix domain-containing protein [Microbacterium sp. Leaf151]|uniref:helix-turn-helix domain-containing protein n=1 Tax=Microbacterium sp. Leaf151 TaxID=1736276 RepID=UPI0006FD29C2|nr:helix-turn-helix transcriptional regulator [Microbacterium sp. Leaf151]KQR23182.1 hypothetical protein ASF76_08120 [Microbacterium sp. Leaf151]